MNHEPEFPVLPPCDMEGASASGYAFYQIEDAIENAKLMREQCRAIRPNIATTPNKDQK